MQIWIKGVIIKGEVEKMSIKLSHVFKDTCMRVVVSPDLMVLVQPAVGCFLINSTILFKKLVAILVSSLESGKGTNVV